MGKLNVYKVSVAKTPGRYQDGHGLSLLVKRSGARSYVLRIQFSGKRRDFGLGRASDTTLAEAREKAAEYRKLVRAGLDPTAKRIADPIIPLFRDAAATAHGELKGAWGNTKHRAQWLATLTTYAFPAIGAERVDQITAPQIIELLLPIWLDKPETARRVLQRVVAVLDWAHAKGLRASEPPLRSIRKGLPRQPKNDRHFAALDYAKVAALMKALKATDSAGRLALRFLILTAGRSGEVRGATWEEIDLKARNWIIPRERMKARKEHVVPLSDEALAVLETAKRLRKGIAGEPIFPGNRGKPLSDMTLSKVLRTATSEKVTVHGFRSSFRDWAAEKAQASDSVAEAALAHTNRNKVEAAYRRTNYLEQRRPLMSAWAAYVVPTAGAVKPHVRRRSHNGEQTAAAATG